MHSLLDASVDDYQDIADREDLVVEQMEEELLDDPLNALTDRPVQDQAAARAAASLARPRGADRSRVIARGTRAGRASGDGPMQVVEDDADLARSAFPDGEFGYPIG
jgi:hypothetical protein